MNKQNVRQKGKINAGEWPAIVARHQNGESLTRIARDYGCTGPAIRYVISRSAAPERELDAVSSTGAQLRPTPRPRTNWTPAKAPRAPLPVIDEALQHRTLGEVAAFLHALDVAASEGSPETVQALATACDGVMCGAARVRIELERTAATPAGPRSWPDIA